MTFFPYRVVPHTSSSLVQYHIMVVLSLSGYHFGANGDPTDSYDILWGQCLANCGHHIITML